MHMGDLKAIGKWHALRKNVRAADDGDLVGAAPQGIASRGRQRRVEIAGDEQRRARQSLRRG